MLVQLVKEWPHCTALRWVCSSAHQTLRIQDLKANPVVSGKLDLGMFGRNVSHTIWYLPSRASSVSQVTARQRHCSQWVEITPSSNTISHLRPFPCRFRACSTHQQIRHPHHQRLSRNARIRTLIRKLLAIWMARVYRSPQMWRVVLMKAMQCHHSRRLHARWTP
jgi:hypothetical protein